MNLDIASLSPSGHGVLRVLRAAMLVKINTRGTTFLQNCFGVNSHRTHKLALPERHDWVTRALTAMIHLKTSQTVVRDVCS